MQTLEQYGNSWILLWTMDFGCMRFPLWCGVDRTIFYWCEMSIVISIASKNWNCNHAKSLSWIINRKIDTVAVCSRGMEFFSRAHDGSMLFLLFVYNLFVNRSFWNNNLWILYAVLESRNSYYTEPKNKIRNERNEKKRCKKREALNVINVISSWIANNTITHFHWRKSQYSGLGELWSSEIQWEKLNSIRLCLLCKVDN